MNPPFTCPSEASHSFATYHDFRHHLVKCRLLQEKTVYICPFAFTHMFLKPETRDLHAINCPCKEAPASQLQFTSLKLGTKFKEVILSSKFDEKELFLPSTSEKNSHSQVKAEPSRSLDKNSARDLNLSERYQENNQNSIILSRKLESLVHVLIFGEDKRLEIIVRRRSTQWRLIMKEFSISEFVPIFSFGHLLQESFTQELYENQYFIGEYTLFSGNEQQIALYTEFLKLFESGDLVAVNTFYKDTHNEVLLICTNRTKYIGKYIKKGDMALLLFKYTVLYNKVRILHGQSFVKSPWIEPYLNNLPNFEMNNNEFEESVSLEIKREKGLGSVKSEIIDGKYKHPIHIYQQDKELPREHERDIDSLDIELEMLEKKNQEYSNLLYKQSEQYKNRLSELETENQSKKNEIKQYVQMINLLEKTKLDSLNDLNNHDFLFKEAKKIFDLRVNEEIAKHKEKYREIFERKSKEYDAELKEKINELPIKERELIEFQKDFEQKSKILEQEEKQFNELKAKLQELKASNDKLMNRERFLEMRKQFNGVNPKENNEFTQELCSICLKAKRNIIFLPCRHFVACEGCALKAQNDREFMGCLHCKADVKQKKKIEWE